MVFLISKIDCEEMSLSYMFPAEHNYLYIILTIYFQQIILIGSTVALTDCSPS